MSFTASSISSGLPPSLVICWIIWLPMLLVMTMIVFVKSTVRPWPSVRRPSSSTCSSTLNTSRWAFSISSSSTTLYGRRRTASVSSAAFFVADVARRGADQAADVVLLAELAHVDADDGLLAVEHDLGQGLAQLGFADAGGAEEEERADRAVAGPAGRCGCGGRRCADGGDRLVLADDPLVQPLFHHEQLGLLGFEHAADGNAGPGADDLGDFVLGHFLAEEPLFGWASLRRARRRRRSAFRASAAGCRA